MLLLPLPDLSFPKLTVLKGIIKMHENEASPGTNHSPIEKANVAGYLLFKSAEFL